MIIRKIYFLFIILTMNALAFDKESIDKSKAIWTNPVVNLYHQFFLMEAFRPLNVGLCEFENSDYQNWINLNSIADPISKELPTDYDPDNDSDDIFNIGYKANIDHLLCGSTENYHANIIKAYQGDSSDPLNIKSFNKYSLGENILDARRNINIYNEKTDSNPYGEIEYDFGVFSYSWQAGLYQASTRSSIEEEANEVTVDSISVIDAKIVYPNLPVGAVHEMYSSKIKHKIGGNGYGTITSFVWGNANFSLANNGLTHGVYPDGIPDVVRTVNFAYNNEYLLYQETYTTTPSSPYVSSNKVTNENICLSRSNFWIYVPDNLGYGVYNINGDLVAENSGITVQYSQETSQGIWNGTLNLNPIGLGIPTVCKNMLDGSIASSELCNGSYGYQNIPLFDVPDGTILIDADNNEYYVRQLKPRTTYAVVEMTNCSDLDIEETLSTLDHKSFVYLEGEIPPSGALLFNQFADKSDFDILYGGKVYIANQDDDGDGILNFLDAFPEDPSKSKDDDYDGIADSEDSNINQTTPAWNKLLDKELFSNYSH